MKLKLSLTHLVRKSLFTALGATVLLACQEQAVNAPPTIVPIDGYAAEHGQEIPGQYIVVMHAGSIDMAGKVDPDYESRQVAMTKVAGMLLERNNGRSMPVERVFSSAIEGFVLNTDDTKFINQLLSDPTVAYIENDKVIALAPPPGKGPGGGGGEDPAQETPWGISRVNGGVTYSGNATAWVIDSGIDMDHPDLNVDASRSASFLGGKDANDPDDTNGHGTHVAGTIGAIDNSIGVVGVAAGATLVSVRVLNRRGSGSTSGVIAGVDYVGANGSNGDVANMSLGGGVSTALDNAVVNASSGGIKFVLAAGNESNDANNSSPARANGPNIYTISSMAIGDNWSSFSNYGNPPVDYCAPGSSVKSTWKNGGYNTISGTSMASPHAAGVLLLGAPKTSGTVIGDPDGEPDVIIAH